LIVGIAIIAVIIIIVVITITITGIMEVTRKGIVEPGRIHFIRTGEGYHLNNEK
jgi:hypothetical protein